MSDQKMAPSEVRETILALKLMHHCSALSPELCADVFAASMENRLYDRIINSFCWNADIPFYICFAAESKKKTAKAKPKLESYCLADDERFRNACKAGSLAGDRKTYTEELGRKIFRAAMEEIANKISGKGRSFLQNSLISEVALRIWNLTNSAQEAFSGLVENAWGESAKQLTEILITVDVPVFRQVDGNFLLLDGVPQEVTRAYYSGFEEFTSVNRQLLDDTAVAIKKVERLTEDYPFDFLISHIGETVHHLRQQYKVVEYFNTRIELAPGTSIRLVDMSLNGFLNYPLPPI